ncbi:hypothetical protein E1B28_009631 [Marasmius oreades]|uniref:Uncharacterized protein n=1 Tax=Marasmius oreades TaxID=181124 RepID=A0A9P7RVG0_9AGAR|nr:uncharacterized protein E1B28_009631 [Marasmius oreades]KAG7090521.1 hypothetical protein E1B28_009631 [Marasmius oreades]
MGYFLHIFPSLFLFFFLLLLSSLLTMMCSDGFLVLAFFHDIPLRQILVHQNYHCTSSEISDTRTNAYRDWRLVNRGSQCDREQEYSFNYALSAPPPLCMGYQTFTLTVPEPVHLSPNQWVVPRIAVSLS